MSKRRNRPPDDALPEEEGVDRNADDQRWWRFYREEKRKMGIRKRDRATDVQIVRAAREASRRFRATDAAAGSE